MADWRSSMTHAETAVWSKVLTEDDSANILGAHMVGHGAEEVIQLFALAAKHDINADGLAETIYGYPILASDMKFMV